METFKQIPGYEGLYEVSNLGNVKSLPKIWGKGQSHKEVILKQHIEKNGYCCVSLRKDLKVKTIRVHRLVVSAFIGLKNKFVIDHINGIKTDNNIKNLRQVTNRENMSFDNVKRKTTSNFIGVTWHKRDKKWQSSIRFNNKSIYLGSYNTEIEAANAYQNELKHTPI